MLLMIEELYDTTEVITEEKDGKKNLYIQGVYAQGNVKNGNGRMYPTPILAEAVRKYVKNVVDKNDALGELNHPPSPVVNPERACHRIVEIKQPRSVRRWY
jgi:hypothetical protein